MCLRCTGRVQAWCRDNVLHWDFTLKVTKEVHVSTLWGGFLPMRFRNSSLLQPSQRNNFCRRRFPLSAAAACFYGMLESRYHPPCPENYSSIRTPSSQFPCLRISCLFSLGHSAACGSDNYARWSHSFHQCAPSRKVRSVTQHTALPLESICHYVEGYLEKLAVLPNL